MATQDLTVLPAFFLENISAAGTNGVSLSKTQFGILDNNSLNPFVVNSTVDIRSFETGNGYQVAIAEVAGVVTATEPTLAASTTYGFTIQQFNPVTRTWAYHTIAYNTGTGALTAGTAATAWAAQLALYADIFVTTGVVGAVLTITTVAGYPMIQLTNSIGIVALAVSTAGVTSLGYPWDLKNAGYSVGTTPGGYLSTGIYDLVDMYWYSILKGNPEAGTRRQRYNVKLWIDQGATNKAAFKTSLLAVLQMTKANATLAALATA